VSIGQRPRQLRLDVREIKVTAAILRSAADKLDHAEYGQPVNEMRVIDAHRQIRKALVCLAPIYRRARARTPLERSIPETLAESIMAAECEVQHAR